MSGSPLKGADAFLVRRRLVLRAATYAVIFLMAVVNLGMICSSWSSTRFMRENGVLAGALNTASSLATMITSGLLCIAAVIDRRAQKDGQPSPPLSARLGHPSVDRLISSVMAAWWLAQALMISDVSYIFREEIRRCIAHRLPRSHLPRGVSASAAAVACTVLRGSLALNWMLFVAWTIRTWRSFTRATTHFDSSIFREPSESMLDLHAIKASDNLPTTFSPHYPGKIPRPKQILRTRELLVDESRAAQQPSAIAPASRPMAPPGMCQCADCPMSYVRIQMPTHEVVADEIPMAQPSDRHPDPPPVSTMCCQQLTVGTATLMTEPVAASPLHHSQLQEAADDPSSQLHQWAAASTQAHAAHSSTMR
ncbi:hypothetical protein GGI10_001528 [Coemansia sp. RSA 2530]|nr:hypothetical protein GGI10_001528 [Coemansia sp. RSA 2530]